MAGNDYVNLFGLTYDDINGIKKKELVDYIKKLKGEVLAENVKSLLNTHERLTSELMVVKNVNNILD